MRCTLLHTVVWTLACVLPAWAGVDSSTIQLVDVQKTRIVAVPRDAIAASSEKADVIVLGGSLGGVAAAMAACDAGRTVVLTEETDWLGGQATSQGVSALDENGQIETSGGTRTYLDFRKRIRDWYRQHTRLTAAARQNAMLDPGDSWVSKLTFEPKAAVAAIGAMLEPHREAGRLRVLLRHKVVRAQRSGRQIEWVDLVDLDNGKITRLSGAFFIDATELGDALPVCGVGYVGGAESFEQTGEPHARKDGPHPECVQSYTYPFVLRLLDQPAKPIARPADYDQNLAKQPYTLRHLYDDRGWVRFGMFEHTKGTYGPFWTYRRLIDRANFDDPAYAYDVAMINWPGNDYRGINLLDDSPERVLQGLCEAKLLALGFCHWLQTEAPRDGGGNGYPEMQLDTAVMDTADGLSKFPYIREARRIKALCTVVEQDVAKAFQPDRVRARHFGDSVGIGSYGIDIHPNEAETKLPPSPTSPFQIPLGALIPRDTDNLLAGCKNIGTTHITNGCYREHPIEWNVGEAAGLLAAECIREGTTPQTLHGDARRVLKLQRRLVHRGVPIFWYDDVGVADTDFERAQLAPFIEPAELQRTAKTMHYRDGSTSQP